MDEKLLAEDMATPSSPSREEDTVSEGWTNLGGQSKKWHYIIDGRSLCHKWMVWKTHELEQGEDDSPDNCADCRRRLGKRLQKKKANRG